MISLNPRLLGSAAAVLLCVHPGYAAAQTATNSSAQPATQSGAQGLDEIVVTAQKRSESLQKVPVTVSAFTGSNLATRGITELVDLAALTPGLQLNNGNGVILPFLRGVGSTANAVGNESSVATYVDGVYFTRLTPGFFSLANIDRVEVLKGPQGTLFGRNSSGGVIQVITPDPSFKTQFNGHIGYGSFDTVKGDAYVTTGLTDTVAMDLSVSGQKQNEGFGRNLTTGHRTWFTDEFTARSKLLFVPTDQTKITLTGFYSYYDGTGASTTFPGTVSGRGLPDTRPQPHVPFYDEITDIDNRTPAKEYGGSLIIEHDLGFASIKSISAYIQEKEHGVFSLEKSPNPGTQADLFANIRQVTQELQLSSTNGSKLQWILGFFYYNTKSGYVPIAFRGGILGTPGDYTGEAFNLIGRQHVISYSGYAQATYEIIDRLRLTGGIRYTHDKSTLDGGQSLTVNGADVPLSSVNGEVSVGKVTYKAGIDYQFTPNILGYFSYSRGFKSGGFNLAPANPAPIKPEVLDAYEVGLKTELFDRRLRVNLAGFWYDIKDPQVQLLSQVILVSNAGSARVKGVELDGALAVTHGLSVTFAANYLNSKYRKYDNAPSGPPNPLPPFGAINPLLSINAAGNYTPNAPKFTASVGGQYQFDSSIGQWVLSADYSYNDGYFFEPDNFLHQGSFSLVGAQVLLKPNDHLNIAVWGKNLGNEKIVTYAATQAGNPGYPYIPQAPRTYGVTVGFKL